MMNQRLRLGVIGAGRIGKIHIENLATRIVGAEVAAISEVSATEREAMAARFGIPKAFADYRELLDLPELDAVVICSPTDQHYGMIVETAARGKHIFCEKPIDLSLEKVRAANAEVARRGVQMMVGFNRRFDANFQKVRESVAKGAIGQPQILRITSRDPGPPPEAYIRASGGLFLDMTIHDFDMARYLMGSEVTEVFTRAAVMVDPVFERAGDWDTAVTTLTFENAAFGVIDNSRKAAYGYDQRAEVFGSAGMVAIGNNTPDAHMLADRSGVHAALPLDFFLERYAESYVREMRAFVEAIGSGTPVPVGGEDGLKAARIALAAGKSAREKRPVALAEIGEDMACQAS